MRAFPLLAPCLALSFAGALQAVDPPSPVRLVPAEANLLLEVPEPRRLVATALQLEAIRQLQTLPAVQQALASTASRRGRQLLAYFEKSMGGRWPDLLDRLAGGGVVVASRVGPNDPPALLVVQARDEKLMERFVPWLVALIDDELSRQESSEKVSTGTRHGVPVHRVGKNLHLARVGAALLVSNQAGAMDLALALHHGKGTSLATRPELQAAAKLLPATPLARLWLDMRPIQASPQGKELYQSPRDNTLLTILFGGTLDLLGRTPFVAAALTEQKDGLGLAIRAPVARGDLGPEGDLHLAPPGQPGSRPLLEPRETIYSASFYFDAARIWSDRDRLLPKQTAADLAQNDKNSGRFLGGIRLSSLLETSGPYHRFVVANSSARVYKRQPNTRLPAFAVVTEPRDAERFGRSMDTLLRAAALASTGTFKLKLVEEKYAGCDLVAYPFDEKAVVRQDSEQTRYNFYPCFARVGGQFVVCSSIDLCRELIDLLQAEAKAPGKSLPASLHDRFSFAGLAAFLGQQQDSLVMQTILDRAVPPAAAKQEVERFLDLLRGAGVIVRTMHVDSRQASIDLRLHYPRK